MTTDDDAIKFFDPLLSRVRLRDVCLLPLCDTASQKMRAIKRQMKNYVLRFHRVTRVRKKKISACL